MRLVYDTNDGEEIPISELFGGVNNGLRWRLKTTDEFGHRHARNEAGTLDNLFATVVPDNDAVNVSSGPIDPDHLGFGPDGPLSSLDLAPDCVPHHSGPEARIVKFLDQGLYLSP